MRGMVIEVSKCVSLNSLLEMREYEDPTAYRYSSVVVSILYWRCLFYSIYDNWVSHNLFQFSIGDAKLGELSDAGVVHNVCFNSLLEMPTRRRRETVATENS